MNHIQRNTSPSEWRALSIVCALLATQPIWEAWQVFSTGTMANVHCNGLYAGRLCSVGLAIGNLVFGAAQSHLGYGFVIGAMGVFILAAAWGAFARAKYA